MTQFKDLGLNRSLLRALAEEAYTQPTPIQAQAIPPVLGGRDLLGVAQTGTGKTAAFALPILHRLAADPKAAPRRGARVLVLAPTRELASQIADSFRAYGRHLGLSVAVVFGGVKYGPQIRALAAGVDVLVATPGRLLDHIGEKVANLGGVETLVLDEADQMLDLGFLPAIRRIVAGLPRSRQNLFFSATMPAEIAKLAGELLNDPARVSITPPATTVEKVDQRVLFVESDRKRAVLAGLFDDGAMSRALIFARTKRGADRVAKHLEEAGVDAQSIHGDKSQGQRERALAAFKNGHVRALVATDIAARGIDVDGVTHVVNHDLPNVPEAYVHRIGRTARAGAGGIAISLVADDERGLLRDIQKLTRQTIPAVDQRRRTGAISSPQPEAKLAAQAEERSGRRGRSRSRPRTPADARGGHAGGSGKGHLGRHRSPSPGRPSPVLAI